LNTALLLKCKVPQNTLFKYRNNQTYENAIVGNQTNPTAHFKVALSHYDADACVFV
jgi:hypothetical protein